MVSPAQDRAVLSFGPFSLVVSERLLTRDGVPVELGGRALDLLIALLSRAGEVVGKDELLALVWPHARVEEGSLRVHVAGLRKALGDGSDGSRYIETTPGRGYRFVVPVARSIEVPDAGAAGSGSVPQASLPARLLRTVGRADDVRRISTRLTAARLVTIVGAGGVGKTTVAVAVAHEMLASFAGAVVFIDLGMLGDPRLAASAVASMLGLSVQSEDATPGVVAHLRGRRLLLVLDTCEHLVEAVAALVSRIVAAAPEVCILATSREALQVEGEQVHRLEPLASPPDEPGLTAAAAQAFPATQLFLERAEASGARLGFSDADAAIVASICRKLDGVALAIELAAMRVEAYGLRQTAALLDERLTLLSLGSRTAPPRQRTLQATLDWSFGLLSDTERLVLRRLAVFVGHFTLEAALSVVTSPTLDEAIVLGAIDSLVAKSMVATQPVGAMMRYRLLDATRAYALQIDLGAAEQPALAARHATYCCRWLEQSATEWPTLSSAAERATQFASLSNVRAALEWSFGADGDGRIGVALAVAAAPVFQAMSLLTECHRWSERAIRGLDRAARGGREEMQLQAALAMSEMFTRGQSEAARIAFERSLAIAEDRGDAPARRRLLSLLQIFHMRAGDYRAALEAARRSAAVPSSIDDPVAAASAAANLGASLYLMGDLDGARRELEAALSHRSGARGTGPIDAGFDHDNRVGLTLARTLWFQGQPGRAVAAVRSALEDAARRGHPVSQGLTLQWAASLFLATGDLGNAEAQIDRFIAHAESHSLGPYVAVGHGLRGELAVLRGDPQRGVESLQAALKALRAARYELLTTEFNIALVQGLAAMGRLGDGLALLDESLRLVEANGDTSYLPELLRLRGSLLRRTSPPDEAAAEAVLSQSLELSRRQGARAWELRTANELAALWLERGRPDIARALLRPVVERFDDGFDTADLRAARQLLGAAG
jgi:predicted ATPase/DNA-binding winged helix-turn-helix (wHTH) protein